MTMSKNQQPQSSVMMYGRTTIFLLLSLLCPSNGLSSSRHDARVPPRSHSSSVVEESNRRKLLGSLVVAAAGSLTFARSPSFADEEEIEVYFGCGCFWHVQHEFVEAERRILGRQSDEQLTARAGYAGGKAGAVDGKVCYHNAGSVADYGKLGHAEVVRLKIPPSSFSDFVTEYCNLFDEKGNRPDQFGDRGTEYRNLVGVPGGSQSEYAKQLVSASQAAGDKLDFAKGKGDDADARAVAFVMDTASFPFFVAEQYHQFHDGFNIGENYPNSYNDIAKTLSKEGTLGTSNCPNGLLGLGALGL